MRAANVGAVNRRPLAQVFLGLLIVVIGVVALLDQFDVGGVSLGWFFSTWWPALIIAVGLAGLAAAPRAWAGPVVVIVVGVLFQLQTLGVVDVNVWQIIWPIAIIFVGLAVLTRLAPRRTDENRIHASVLWSGAERRTSSQDFRGGSLNAVMGGIQVDLREAGIVESAEISIFTLWGGIEITVPPTWRVQVGGMPVLGGWDDRTTDPQDPTAPVLVVRATAIMGGVEIKN